MRFQTILATIFLMFAFSCSKQVSYDHEVRSALSKDFSFFQPDYYPTRDWKTKPLETAGFSREKLQKLEDYLFPEIPPGIEEARTGVRTDGIVIIHNGYIVYEKYGRGYDKDSKHITWSVTKSYVNTLAGMLVKEKKIALDDFAYKYYPELNKGKKKTITVRHLINMSSGLKWDEGYESSPVFSDVVAMLYTLGHRDMAHYAATRPLTHKPGTFWYYSSGETNLLSRILMQAAGGEEEYEKLFSKFASQIGMNNYTIERDHSGNIVGSSYLYTTPREMAKLGLLYFANGKWENESLFPEDWVKFTLTMAKGYYTTPKSKDTVIDNPGAHWMLNVGIPETGQERVLPNSPTDLFYATGHWGQRIIVIPSHSLIIARTGDDRDGTFSPDKMISLIVDAHTTGGSK